MLIRTLDTQIFTLERCRLPDNFSVLRTRLKVYVMIRDRVIYRNLSENSEYVHVLTLASRKE